MAEIEHFVHPDKRNDFHKFSSVSDLRIAFFSACRQMDGSPAEELRLGEAVKSVGHVMVMLQSCGGHVTAVWVMWWSYDC